MPALRPAFSKDGSVTAANASKIDDGAAALILMSKEEAQKRGLTPMATIKADGSYAHDPSLFTTAPVGAITRSLEKANLTADDVDFYEINEAFSVVTLFAMQELKIPREKVNAWGGAVALGHPIGCSGARILVTLLSTLAREDKKVGCASLCIGGGEAVSVIVER